MPLKFKYSKLFTSVTLAILASSSYASTVRTDVDYQYFRDFAENKGQFNVGASNIVIYDEYGINVGTMLKNLPMPDFYVADFSGIATLIGNQHITSVAHNGGYTNVRFGDRNQNQEQHTFAYRLVDRNNFPLGTGVWEGKDVNKRRSDYHTPRLAKIVTEVAPIDYVREATDNQQENTATFVTGDRYTAYLRMGSGVQSTQKAHDKYKPTRLAGAYSYVTGGVPHSMKSASDIEIVGYGSVSVFGNNKRVEGIAATLYDNKDGPLVSNAKSGDSGSPLLVYDNQEQRWKLIGVLNFDYGYGDIWSLPRVSFIEYNFNKAVAGSINTQAGQDLEWRVNDAAQGQSSITLTAASLAKLTGGVTDKGNNVATAETIDASNALSSTTINTGNVFVKREVFNQAPRAFFKDSVVNGKLDVAIANPTLKKEDKNGKQPSVDHGKDVFFKNSSDNVTAITLKDSINQGAGSLYFDGNYTFQADSNQTWMGGGVVIADNKTVTWSVNGVDNDRMSKIGKGTLHVRASGNNLGSISVGDGRVILDQQADAAGNKQAFSEVGITSGRATVVLNSADQINPNNLYFGFRGGRLDVNGYDLAFTHIQNSDAGGKIVNHNATQGATITLGAKYQGNLALSKTAQTFQQATQHLYGGSFGEDDPTLPNGQLNLVHRPDHAQGRLILTGGMNLNGTVTNELGEIYLAGLPTSHAYDHLKKQEVIRDNEWETSNYKATSFITKAGSTLTFGRNIGKLDADLILETGATLNLGYTTDQQVCQRLEYTGNISCEVKHYSDDVLKSIPTTVATGNLTAAAHAQVTLGRVHFYGGMVSQAATTLNGDASWTLTQNSSVGNLTLKQGSRIILGQSNLTATPASRQAAVNSREVTTLAVSSREAAADLMPPAAVTPTVASNSEATTSDAQYDQSGELNKVVQASTTASDFHTLTVANDLSGTGSFEFRFDGDKVTSDKVVVKGSATGTFNVNLISTTQEAQPEQNLVLFEINDTANNNLTLNLGSKDYVDIGALRYRLSRENNSIVLKNPIAQQRRADRIKAEEEAKAKAAEQARLEEARRQAELQAKLAEEKRQAELKAAEQARLEEEQRLAAQQARLEEERRQAELQAAQQAKLEEARRQAQLQATEKARLEQEKRQAELQAKLEEEQRLAAQQALQQELRNIEAQRLAAEQAAQSLQASLQAQEVTHQQQLALGKTNQEKHQQQAAALKLDQEAQRLINQARQAAAKALEAVKEAQRLATLARQAQEQAQQVAQQAVSETDKAQAKQAVALATEQVNKVQTVVAQAQQASIQAVELARQAGVVLNAADEANATISNTSNGVTITTTANNTTNVISSVDPTQANSISTYANAVVSDSHAQMSLVNQQGLALNDSLLALDSSSNSSWVKVRCYQTSYGSDLFRDFSQKTNATEIGIASGYNELGISGGLVLNYAQASNSLNENASSSNKYTHVTSFLKAKAGEHGYFFADFSLGSLNNKINATESTSFQRNVLTLGAGVGGKLELGSFTLNAITGVRGNSLDATDFKLGAMQVKANRTNVVNYYASVQVSKKVTLGSVELKPFASVSFAESFSKNYDGVLFANNVDLALSQGRDVTVATGLDLKVAQAVNLSSQLSYNRSNKAKDTKQIDLKLSYKF